MDTHAHILVDKLAILYFQKILFSWASLPDKHVLIYPLHKVAVKSVSLVYSIFTAVALPVYSDETIMNPGSPSYTKSQVFQSFTANKNFYSRISFGSLGAEWLIGKNMIPLLSQYSFVAQLPQSTKLRICH